MERTYIMIKPDGVQRGLVGEIISRFEKKGLKLVASKLARPPQEKFEEHYDDLKEKPFFPPLVKHMTTAPVLCMVWAGANAVVTVRKMLGETVPLNSAPGTIRGDFALETRNNLCHGSSSVEEAEREIALWFPEGVLEYTKTDAVWIYEQK